MADSLETRHCPCVTVPDVVVLSQTVRAYVQRSTGKNNAPRILPSRSLKVIGTARDRSGTYDLLIVILSNHEPNS